MDDTASNVEGSCKKRGTTRPSQYKTNERRSVDKEYEVPEYLTAHYRYEYTAFRETSEEEHDKNSTAIVALSCNECGKTIRGPIKNKDNFKRHLKLVHQVDCSLPVQGQGQVNKEPCRAEATPPPPPKKKSCKSAKNPRLTKKVAVNENLCLICCYAFPVKSNRFISHECIQSLHQFSEQLGFPLEGEGGVSGGSDLCLPFGERINVCGDCLSLVDVYVQRSCVQREKEETLLELQKKVSKLIRELTSVVEEVKGHIDTLHSYVRLGEEGNLGKFVNENGEENARSFRKRVLSVNISSGKFQKTGDKDKRRPSANDDEIFIKPEPLGNEPDWNSNDEFVGEEANGEVDSSHEAQDDNLTDSSSPSTPTSAKRKRQTTDDKRRRPTKAKRKCPSVEDLGITEHSHPTKTMTISDRKGYSYRQSYGSEKTGVYYFRCAHRNCVATIIRKNGGYSRLHKGWGGEGGHSAHYPDRENERAVGFTEGVTRSPPEEYD